MITDRQGSDVGYTLVNCANIMAYQCVWNVNKTEQARVTYQYCGQPNLHTYLFRISSEINQIILRKKQICDTQPFNSIIPNPFTITCLPRAIYFPLCRKYETQTNPEINRIFICF